MIIKKSYGALLIGTLIDEKGCNNSRWSKELVSHLNESVEVLEL